jgi:thymidine phosphorylase
MLRLANRADSHEAARAQLAAHLHSGAAWQKWLEMVRQHGGDAAALEDTTRLPQARLQEPLPAPQTGFFADADAETIGKACLLLGAGRARTTDGMDHAVGIAGMAKIGEHVERGQPLAVLHANDPARLAEARKMMHAAFRLEDNPVTKPVLTLEEVMGSG